jgi:hypothetical protein
VLLAPELARRIALPKPADASGDGAALAALAALCESSASPLTTAAVMQHFAGTPNEAVLVAVLTTVESDALAGESLEIELAEGVKRYWLNAHKRGHASLADSAPPIELSAEETERARQRNLARQGRAGGV